MLLQHHAVAQVGQRVVPREAAQLAHQLVVGVGHVRQLVGEARGRGRVLVHGAVRQNGLAEARQRPADDAAKDQRRARQHHGQHGAEDGQLLQQALAGRAGDGERVELDRQVPHGEGAALLVAVHHGRLQQVGVRGIGSGHAAGLHGGVGAYVLQAHAAHDGQLRQRVRDALGGGAVAVPQRLDERAREDGQRLRPLGVLLALLGVVAHQRGDRGGQHERGHQRPQQPPHELGVQRAAPYGRRRGCCGHGRSCCTSRWR